MRAKENIQTKGEGARQSVFMYSTDVYLTTPGSFISAMRYSGSPAGGSTNNVNSGLETASQRHIEEVGNRVND